MKKRRSLQDDLKEKLFSGTEYEKLSRNQAKKLGTIELSPSESKEFHRDGILFQLYHLNTGQKCYDHWDKVVGIPRSSLRNAILDKRLAWDCKKARKNVEKGKPHFCEIKSATFPFPVRVITLILENEEYRWVEYLQLNDEKDYRVVYVWRERKDMKEEYNARIISLHEAGDNRGEVFIKSHLLKTTFFVDGTGYAAWAPRATLTNNSENAIVALYEYPQFGGTKKALPLKFSGP